jgi:hypothetical protein
MRPTSNRYSRFGGRPDRWSVGFSGATLDLPFTILRSCDSFSADLAGLREFPSRPRTHPAPDAILDVVGDRVVQALLFHGTEPAHSERLFCRSGRVPAQREKRIEVGVSGAAATGLLMPFDIARVVVPGRPTGLFIAHENQM